MQGLSPEQINFHPCSWNRRRQGAVSFYFNKLIGCSQNFDELAKDPNIKGIITTREAVEKEMSWEEIEKRYRIIPYDDEIFIILKF
jgi:hypothetical protein